MHKLFFRNFFSILLLSLAILFVITLSTLLFYSNGARDWRESAFEEFVVTVQNELSRDNSHMPVDSVIEKVLRKASDNRICGYIISDIENQRVLVFGSTRFGRKLSEPNPGSHSNQRTRENLQNARKLSITQNGVEILPSAVLPANCPMPVSSKDVVGSLVVSFDDKDLFVIDIITDSPDTYAFTKRIVSSISLSMLIALPTCLVIALLGAWIISAKTAKSVNKINKALTELANGKENVKTGRFTSEDFKNIAKEIGNLDACLQADRKSRKAWLNSISHDLNTPVQAMRFLIDGMNDGLIKKTKSTILDLQKENDNLASKIEKVMLYSTMQSLSKTDFSETRTEDFCKEMSANEEIELELNTETIVCNSSLMSRALKELADNALKFKDEGKVKIAVSKYSEGYEISVSNKGKLNKMQETSDPFEPWTKADFSRNSEGSGLGLPIAGSAVRLHNGTASLTCSDGFVTARVRWPFPEAL